ncbi:hypothetical protein F0562_029606 [Nyssa sinensis]|uniref:Aminotransferase-like plant mobile domain-containing protein n=1 Tax=Nyssa sinensis TaxID=561372 RepID=A0A5J5B3B2_9ASTE|nr:hypothetical protein F0562_029606 [Nyssa sinensis]
MLARVPHLGTYNPREGGGPLSGVLPTPESMMTRRPQLGASVLTLGKLDIVLCWAILSCEVDLSEGLKVSPDSILRLTVECRELPHSFVNYPSNSDPLTDWEEWTDDILVDPAYVSLLTSAEVLDSVRIFCELGCKNELGSLGTLIYQWSTSTHTFITSSGEFTPTLEDVVVLLRLPLLGSGTSSSLELNEKESDACNFLISSLPKSVNNLNTWQKEDVSGGRKESFSAWLRYFYKGIKPQKVSQRGNPREEENGLGLNNPYRLMAYLACWLSHFIFPMPLKDGLNVVVFPFAVKLARGKALQLAPLFLGLLYYRLDSIHTDTTQSVGRYDGSETLDAIRVFPQGDAQEAAVDLIFKGENSLRCLAPRKAKDWEGYDQLAYLGKIVLPAEFATAEAERLKEKARFARQI